MADWMVMPKSELMRSPLYDEWFAPHAEFRFPHVGEVLYRDVQVELRTAIEVGEEVIVAAISGESLDGAIVARLLHFLEAAG